MKSSRRRRRPSQAAVQTDLFSQETVARDQRAALAKAYRLLAIRARSEKELREALARAGYVDAVVAYSLEECKRKGYLDDLAYARQFVQSRLRQRPMGRMRLQLELQQKGIVAETISLILAEAFESSDTTAQLANQLAEKLRKRLLSLPAQKARQRLADHLRRRGFEWEVIQATDLWHEMKVDEN